MSPPRRRERGARRAAREGDPHRAASAAASPASLLLLGAVLLVHLIHALHYSGLIDDAFISFRYARNLAEGRGLVFNPGERVEGYTNLLWVLILSGFMKAGGQPEFWSRALGIAAGAGSLIVVFRATLRACPARPLLALAGPVLLAGNRTFCAWSTGGLETSLFSFLCLLGLVLAGGTGRRAPLLAGTAIGLAALTRPEGTVVFAALALVLAAESLRGGEATAEGADGGSRPAGLAAAALAAGPFLLLAGGQLVFRLAYYGAWMPNTAAVKLAGLYPASGLAHAALFARDNLLGPETVALLLLLLPGAAVSAWAGGARRTLNACLAAAGLYLAYIVAIGGDHFEYRFFHPVFVLLSVPFARGVILLDGIVSASAGRRLAGAFVLLAGAKGLIVSFAGFQNVERNLDLGFQKAHVSIVSVEYEQRFCVPFIQIGQWLGRNAAPDETIVLGAVGAVPYYSGLRTVDIHGLTEPDGGSIPVVERGVVGHERRADRDYVFRRGVTYYIVQPRMRLDGPDPTRLVRVALPDGKDFAFQSVDPDAKIQPGQYPWN